MSDLKLSICPFKYLYSPLIDSFFEDLCSSLLKSVDKSKYSYLLSD